MIEQEFLTLVKYLKEIEFKINSLYLICDKDYSKKWNLKFEMDPNGPKFEIFISNGPFLKFSLKFAQNCIYAQNEQ